jgi:hypothetical protein
VVILDPRIRTKQYGRTFLDALPECEIIEESAAAGAESDPLETPNAPRGFGRTRAMPND